MGRWRILARSSLFGPVSHNRADARGDSALALSAGPARLRAAITCSSGCARRRRERRSAATRQPFEGARNERCHPPAVDVARPEVRPGLALLLAILAVPGSTLAWDLPAGGFWIGALSVAAIVLGVRARRAGAGTGKATAAIVIGGLMLALTIMWTIVSVVS